MRPVMASRLLFRRSSPTGGRSPSRTGKRPASSA